MAIVANRAEIGLKDIGTSVQVPDDPRAKLMFYLKSMCTVLDLDDPNISRLIDYRNYLLTAAEEAQLLLLCYALSPDELNGKCIFQDENGEMCGNRVNAFYELSAVQNRFLVTENILIGNQQRHVKKMMFYKMSFIQDYYLVPMIVLKVRLDAILEAQRMSRPAITYNQPTYITMFRHIHPPVSMSGLNTNLESTTRIVELEVVFSIFLLHLRRMWNTL